jgi:hypothetical protein
LIPKTLISPIDPIAISLPILPLPLSNRHHSNRLDVTNRPVPLPPCHCHSRASYRHISGSGGAALEDLEASDPALYKSLLWVRDNSIENVLDLTFSVENERFGVVETVDLVPNGREIPVTDESKSEWV